MKNLSYFIKLKIKDILKKYGIKLEKLSEIDLKINKINLLSNSYEKINLYKDLIKKNPESHLIHLYLIKELHKVADPEKFEHFDIYNNKRNNWINEVGLNDFNLDFIWAGMVTGSLGNHYPIESLINSQKLNMRKNNKINIILPKKIKLRNKSFFSYFEKYVNLIQDTETIYSFNTLASILELPLGICVPMDKICPSLDAASNITQSLLAERNIKSLFQLKSKDQEKGKSILKKLGLPSDAWYVTLHARSVGYRGENQSNTSDDFRNTDIKSYLKAIKFITDQGGWVFRMGDPSMTKLKNMNNVIDYAHCDERSEFLDVFLGATSKFCIGSSSGYYHIPFTFSVPVLFTNSPRFEEYYGLRKNNLYLPRMLNKKNEKIEIEKFMNTPLGIINNKNLYKQNNIGFIPNSEEDIYQATKEIYNNIENNFSNVKRSQKQEKFIELARKKSNQYSKIDLIPQANISVNFIEKEI